MCDQQRLRPACAYAQTDQRLCWSLKYFMTVKLLTETHLRFLSLKGGSTGSSESTLVKIPHCWKSRVKAHIFGSIVYANAFCVYSCYAHGPDVTENVNHQHKQNKNMRGSREFCQRRSISEYFSFDKGREDQIPRKAGDHRPANETPFKWRFVGGPMIAQQ